MENPFFNTATSEAKQGSAITADITIAATRHGKESLICMYLPPMNHERLATSN
jgi:hypothetical protein